MTRSSRKNGRDLESTGIASGAREAGEAKQPADNQRTGGAARYLYMAGVLATLVLLIMLAAV
jgi:hypothetical protein